MIHETTRVEITRPRTNPGLTTFEDMPPVTTLAAKENQKLTSPGTKTKNTPKTAKQSKPWRE